MALLGEDTSAQWEVASRSAGVLAGQLAQLNWDLVVLMAEVIETACWAGGGITSPEHWLQVMMAVSPARAADIVTVARRKGDFPELEERLARGAVSLDQFVVVAKHVPARYAEAVTAFVENATVSQLRRVLPKYQFEPEPDDTAAPKPAPDDAPHLSMHTSSGRFVMRFEASLIDGALVENALREAKDALFTAGDAHATLADGLLEIAGRSLQTVEPADRRRRYQVLLHLDADGNGWLNKKGALPPRLVERLTCDTDIRPVWERDAIPVSVGRSQRIVPDRTRRLIEDRDGGCRYPGCQVTRFLENHHLTHWSHGGATDIDQLVSLCQRHHREHHQGHFTIAGQPATPAGLTFQTRYGLPIQATIPTEIPAPEHPPPVLQPVRGWPLDTAAINFQPAE